MRVCDICKEKSIFSITAKGFDIGEINYDLCNDHFSKFQELFERKEEVTPIKAKRGRPKRVK